MDLDRITAQMDRGKPVAELTDAGNAQRFVREHGNDVRYVPAWGWVVWDGMRWQRDELAARERMIRTARSIHREAAKAKEKDDQKAIASWAAKSQSAPRLQGALWCAQPTVAGTVDEFDRKPWLLPVANGTVDLRTGALGPHRREHMITRMSPVIYAQGATSPAWDAFLARVLPDIEVREFMRRFAGYCLTGETREQVLAFLYGGGRNGKSVFIETLAALAGEFHTATRMETLAVKSGGGIPNDIAALAGARLVTVSETPEGSRVNEALVKDMTGGDTVAARFLHREYFQFVPTLKLVIRGNHKPQIRGTDDGIWRRLLLVPFTVQIPEAEVDADLPRKIREELPGVLAWAIEGCIAWQQDGLRPPAAVLDAVQEYRDEMDLIGAFIAERCLVAGYATAGGSQLYLAYREWAEKCGQIPLNNNRFGAALKERGFASTRPKGTVWHGLGLIATDYPPAESAAPQHTAAVSGFLPSRARNPEKVKPAADRCGGAEDWPTDYGDIRG